MKEVSKKEFYDSFWHLNVQNSISETYPFTSTISLKTGQLVAKQVDQWTDNIPNKRPIITKYYIA